MITQGYTNKIVDLLEWDEINSQTLMEKDLTQIGLTVGNSDLSTTPHSFVLADRPINWDKENLSLIKNSEMEYTQDLYVQKNKTFELQLIKGSTNSHTNDYI